MNSDFIIIFSYFLQKSYHLQSNNIINIKKSIFYGTYRNIQKFRFGFLEILLFPRQNMILYVIPSILSFFYALFSDYLIIQKLNVSHTFFLALGSFWPFWNVYFMILKCSIKIENSFVLFLLFSRWRSWPKMIFSLLCIFIFCHASNSACGKEKMRNICGISSRN